MKIRNMSALAVATMASFAFGSSNALAFNTFNIQEGSVPGSANNLVVADTISGSYQETFSATSATDFATVAYFDAGSYLLGGPGGVAQLTQLNNLGAAGYKAYALFDATGTFTISGTGDVSFTALTGSFEFFLDPDADTTKAVPATAPGSVTLGNNADDIDLGGTTVLLAGQGTGCVPGSPGCLALGNYRLIFGSLALTLDGADFFVAPVPFFLELQNTGVFTNFTPTSGSTVILNGAANAFFDVVPEAGSIALVGLSLALVGLFSVRRRS